MQKNGGSASVSIRSSFASSAPQSRCARIDRDDFYHLYYGKLNRCVFNDSPGHDCIFIFKKKGSKLPVLKVYEAWLCLVQKISTRYKSTFFLLLQHGRLESRKAERCSFCGPCRCRTWDQENAIFTDKTHLLNQQEGLDKLSFYIGHKH